jgi:hypothetical protein
MNSDTSRWTIAEAEYDSHPLLIRLREFQKRFPKSKYPQLIQIFWKMSERDENGYPTEEEFTRLATFEDRLVNAVEHDQHSIFVGSLTRNGEKELIFYTADVPGFLECLTNMPQENERYPITIQSEDDPDWSYFRAVTPKAV